MPSPASRTTMRAASPSRVDGDARPAGGRAWRRSPRDCGSAAAAASRRPRSPPPRRRRRRRRAGADARRLLGGEPEQIDAARRRSGRARHGRAGWRAGSLRPVGRSRRDCGRSRPAFPALGSANHSSIARRRRASGERSSWLALASNAFCDASSASTRAAAALKVRATTATSSSPASSTRSDSAPAPHCSTPERRSSSRRVRRAVIGKAASPTPPATISTIVRMRSRGLQPRRAQPRQNRAAVGEVDAHDLRQRSELRSSGRRERDRRRRAMAASAPCGVVDRNVGADFVAETLRRRGDAPGGLSRAGIDQSSSRTCERAPTFVRTLCRSATRTRRSGTRRRRGSPAASDRLSRTAGGGRRS